MSYKIVFFLLCFLLFGCQGQNSKQIDQKILNAGFDVSIDDSKILFALYVPDIGISIYDMPMSGGDSRLIIKSDDRYSYYNPKYSVRGDKIVFIKINKNDPSDRSICIADSNGANLEHLSIKNEIIEDASFSEFEESTIIFISAKGIVKSSPIGVVQPHGMDFYSINYKTKKRKQISKLNAYNISKFSEIDSNTIVMGMMGGDDGGIFLFQKNEYDTAYRFIPKNNPRDDPSLYYTPAYSKVNNAIGFTSPYELYIMSIKDRHAVKLYRYNKQIDDFCFYKTKKKLLFLRDGDLQFMSVDLESLDVKAIPLKVHN